jgi:hypothetical protein
MPTRRNLQLAAPALLVSACAGSGPGEADAARAAHRGVTFVYIGADDCAPCQAWRKTELPKFEASGLRRRVDFRAVLAAHWSYVADPYYWPADLAWIKDDAHLSRGAPQYVVAQDGKLLLRSFGTGSWKSRVVPLLERLTQTA